MAGSLIGLLTIFFGFQATIQLNQAWFLRLDAYIFLMGLIALRAWCYHTDKPLLCYFLMIFTFLVLIVLCASGFAVEVQFLPWAESLSGFVERPIRTPHIFYIENPSIDAISLTKERVDARLAKAPLARTQASALAQIEAFILSLSTNPAFSPRRLEFIKASIVKRINH